jgi:hypothetical protein
MNWRKKTVVAFILLLLGVSLVAQDGIGRTISIRFVDLNEHSSSDDVYDFLWDYSQYQLKILYWEGLLGEVLHLAYFIYNSLLVDTNELLDILHRDNRVAEVVALHLTSRFRPRQFVIRLFDNEAEQEFISHYSGYGLSGSIYAWRNLLVDCNFKLFSYNDTTIYAGDFLDILRDDSRVEDAYIIESWVDGAYIVNLSGNNDIQTLMKDYPHLEFTYMWVGFWKASMCFIEHDEFAVLSQLKDDARIVHAFFEQGPYLVNLYRVKPQPPPGASEHDIVAKRLHRITAYPNPVFSSDVKFRINSENPGARLNSPGSVPIVKIYNIRGQLIRSSTMDSDVFVWDKRDMYNREVSSGVYFVRVSTEMNFQAIKVILVK